MYVLDRIDPDNQIRGHFVLLGAGASRAACLDGDKNGNHLPVMSELAGILGVEEDLRALGVDGELEDFEKIYSQLCNRDDCAEFLQELNAKIWDYFSELELPDSPTIYDKLLLSLRSKDFVATFNWDPFLWQAYARNFKHAELPRPICLHGSVSLGSCQCEDPLVVSYIKNPCPKCGQRMANCDLLYPIGEKDYNSSPFINAAWRDVRAALERSMLFTIFGYAAPVSDKEAICLLKEGWGDVEERFVELIEIIDLDGSDVLEERWKDFILDDNYVTMDDFHSSRVWKFPRRSCEVHWSTQMQCQPVKSSGLGSEIGWEELLGHMNPLIEEEKLDQSID